MLPATWPTSASASRLRRGNCLDFIRLLTEDYFFVCRRAFLDTEPMQRLLDVVKGPAFREAVASLPGYRAMNTGAVSTIKEFLDSVEAPRKRKD